MNESINDKGRYRAARAAKKTQCMISWIFTFSLQGLDDALPQEMVQYKGGAGGNQSHCTNDLNSANIAKQTQRRNSGWRPVRRRGGSRLGAQQQIQRLGAQRLPQIQKTQRPTCSLQPCTDFSSEQALKQFDEKPIVQQVSLQVKKLQCKTTWSINRLFCSVTSNIKHSWGPRSQSLGGPRLLYSNISDFAGEWVPSR